MAYNSQYNEGNIYEYILFRKLVATCTSSISYIHQLACLSGSIEVRKQKSASSIDMGQPKIQVPHAKKPENKVLLCKTLKKKMDMNQLFFSTITEFSFHINIS